MALQYSADALVIAFTFCILFLIILSISVRFVLGSISKPIIYIIFFTIVPSALYILYAFDFFSIPLWKDILLDNILALIAGIIIPFYTLLFVMEYYKTQKELMTEPPSISAVLSIYFMVSIISAIGFPDAVIPNVIVFCVGLLLFGLGSWQKSKNATTLGQLFILVGIVGFLVSFFVSETVGWSFSGILMLVGVSMRSKRHTSGEEVPMVEYCKGNLDDDKCNVFFTEQDII